MVDTKYEDKSVLFCAVFPFNFSPAAPPFVFEYVISFELSTANESVINRLRSILRNVTYPIAVDVAGYPQISEINMTTGTFKKKKKNVICII